MQIRYNLLILALLAIAISLSSCGSDDPTPPSIIGKWKQTAGVYNPVF